MNSRTAPPPQAVVPSDVDRAMCLQEIVHQPGADGRCAECGQRHPCGPYRDAVAFLYGHGHGEGVS